MFLKGNSKNNKESDIREELKNMKKNSFSKVQDVLSDVFCKLVPDIRKNIYIEMSDQDLVVPFHKLGMVLHCCYHA